MSALPPDDELSRLRRDYAELVRRLEANQSRFQRLARSIYRVQEDERRRLARDLHDGLGQNLTALKHHLMMAIGQGATAHAVLQDALSLCDRTLAETRELSRLLRPQVLDDLGLPAALRWLARTLGTPAGLDVELEVEEACTTELDEDLRTLVFRLAQEALTNTVKHAQARHAGFRLRIEEGRLRFEAWDDGQGFDPDIAVRSGSSGVSSGLGAMHERAALHGGTLRFTSRIGAGSQLRLVVPLVDGPVRLAP